MRRSLITLGDAMVPFPTFLAQVTATGLRGVSMVLEVAREPHQASLRELINGDLAAHLERQHHRIPSHREEKALGSRHQKARLAWLTQKRNGQKEANSPRLRARTVRGANLVGDSRVGRRWPHQKTHPLPLPLKERSIGVARRDLDPSPEGAHHVSPSA